MLQNALATLLYQLIIKEGNDGRLLQVVPIGVLDALVREEDLFLSDKLELVVASLRVRVRHLLDQELLDLDAT